MADHRTQRPELASTGQHIAWHARREPDATAIIEHGARISYGNLAADLVRCARALERSGVEPATFVGVETPEQYLHLLLLLACEVIGAATVSLTRDQLSGDDELLRHCDVILASDAAAGPPGTLAIPPDLPAGAPVSVTELVLLDRAVTPGRDARIIRSSGTTGKPKAMMLSFATLRLRITRGIDRMAEPIAANPRLLCLYHLGIGGMHMRVLSVLQLGGTVIFGAMEQTVALVGAGMVNLVLFTTADLERFMRHAEPPPVGHDLHVLVFGAAVPALLRRQVRERLGAPIDNPYSASETNPIAMIGDDGVGTLCPGVEVRIVDGAGRDVPEGHTGRIRTRTETMVQGYFRDPAQTAAAFIDGWYQTGDIGRVPAPGKLIVLGRGDDMLNIGGVKIAPFAIEAELKLIDGVSDAAVMTVASRNDVDKLLAAIEIDSDRPPAGQLRRIGAVLSRHVSTFEIMPLRWFPRTGSGKIKRQEIVAAFHQRRDGNSPSLSCSGLTRASPGARGTAQISALRASTDPRVKPEDDD